MTYIKGAKAPTLIQHGDADQRVPVSNALEMYPGTA
jgi:dipeptidyl aminopeptidase/acylaminoacyl peptidase